MSTPESAFEPPATPTGSGRQNHKRKTRRRAKHLVIGVGAFGILVAAAGCAWIYQLDSNIKHSALDTGSSPQKGA
ncbi:hypothetical protein ABH931_007529, partial [Streptacidiphilus sp. MAP12-33]|uniref:hypothetical protein n=1 Tax=Streptacidiphilus sp. MAP12-33 TaxID=3156266 RepID=UPI0035197FF7